MNFLIRPSVYLLLPLILMFALSVLGCSAATEQKRLRYLEADSIAPLQIPEGLNQPDVDKALPLVLPKDVVTAIDARPPTLKSLSDAETADQ